MGHNQSRSVEASFCKFELAKLNDIILNVFYNKFAFGFPIKLQLLKWKNEKYQAPFYELQSSTFVKLEHISAFLKYIHIGNFN